MAGAAARRGEHRRVRTMFNKEVLRFWKLAPCDVEARVRRLKWAHTLVQDLAHQTQLITAMFGKLPSEPSSTLGLGGEILPEATPWPVRWMADLEELVLYDERGVIQRMGRDVRALLDRELAEDFVAMDVTILRLRSLAVEVPPWDFREEAVTEWNCRRKEFHSGGAVLTNSVRLCSNRSRPWQRTCCVVTEKWRWCLGR